MLVRRFPLKAGLVAVVALCVVPAAAHAALSAPLIQQQILTFDGSSVALSADGNTALVGGSGDALVYTRSAGKWSWQQFLGAPATGPDAQIGSSGFGSSVSLSADGTDALIGGPGDNNGVGAAWVFVYRNGTWSEARKLTAPMTGPDAEIGSGGFGSSVALDSSDGNTALIGGPGDNSSDGAAWVFRYQYPSGWSEQQKLVPPTTGTDAEIGSAAFGHSVALSSDGSTALIGGPEDNRGTQAYARGASWVYARSGSVWGERAKLTAPLSGVNSQNAYSGALVGSSVSLSADANTALVGGPRDGAGKLGGSGPGAAWVFTGSGSSWSEGVKLTPSVPNGTVYAGTSVGLSPDGSTAVISAVRDWSYYYGAAWVYTPAAGGGWSVQQELDATGEFGGDGIALSSDGSTVLIGAGIDSYVFASGPPEPISPPSVSGTLVQGQTLNAANGSWGNAPTSFSHEWDRCDTSGDNCAGIDGATGQSYTLTSADIGHTIRVREWATNAGGTAGPMISAATGVIQTVPPPPTPAPTSIGPPGISGTPAEGQTLAEANGSWTNTPTVYSYQWQRCDASGNNCTAVIGATGQIYTLGIGDVGDTIRVLEWAANSGGIGGPAASPATAVVTAPSGQLPPPAGLPQGSPPPGPPQQGSPPPSPPRPNPAGAASGGQATASTAQIEAQMLNQLAPAGNAAKIGALLKAGGYTFSFRTLTAGRLAIRWYHLPKGARLARVAPVLVAAGGASFTKAGRVKLTIRLTAEGNRMLKASERLTLTAKGTYSQRGKTPVVATKPFTLGR